MGALHKQTHEQPTYRFLIISYEDASYPIMLKCDRILLLYILLIN
jgi:hypothetical protein